MSREWNQTENVATAEAASSSPVSLTAVTATSAAAAVHHSNYNNIVLCARMRHTHDFIQSSSQEILLLFFFLLAAKLLTKPYHNCTIHKLTCTDIYWQNAYNIWQVNRVQHYKSIWFQRNEKHLVILVIISWKCRKENSYSRDHDDDGANGESESDMEKEWKKRKAAKKLNDQLWVWRASKQTELHWVRTNLSKLTHSIKIAS